MEDFCPSQGSGATPPKPCVAMRLGLPVFQEVLEIRVFAQNLPFNHC